MNQGKLEVVKQKMARVNINILGISELKWTGNKVNLTQMTILWTKLQYFGHLMQSPSAVILEPPKIKTVSPSISHEVMGPDAMILVF